MNGNTVRVNVSLPSDLVKDLKKRTSPRGVSRFLAEAAKEKLMIIERDKAFKVLLAGPPAFPEIKDSVKWVRNLRRLDLKRLRRVGI